MVRGRKPVPTPLKLLKGTARACRQKNEPVAPDSPLPSPPGHLDEVALVEWHRLAPMLHANRCLTDLDVNTLASLCVCYSRWVQAEKKVAEDGAVVFGKYGLVMNPWQRISQNMMQQMQSLGADLGLSPASRGRIDLPKVAKDADPLEEFAKKKRG